MKETTSSNQELFKRLFIRFIIAVVLFVLLFYGVPQFFHYLYPFILAFLLAAFVNPLINRINGWLSRLNINSTTSKNFVTFIMTIVIIGIIFLLGYFMFTTLLREIIGLATTVLDNWPRIVSFIEDLQGWLTAQIDILPEQALTLFNSFTERLLTFIQNFSRNLLNFTVTTTGSIISLTGSLTLNFITFFLSLYFLMSDYDSIIAYVTKRTDKEIKKTVNLLKNSALGAVGGYVKTQVIIAMIAFVIMFVALMLYGQEYALTIAILLAIVDIIPLIGTIAVLVPWGIIEFIAYDPSKGIFLILLGVGYFIFRRMVEPKIMGTQTGLHPLFALIGIYVGIQFSGLWGALLGPLVIIVIISILRSGILDNTLADIREFYYKTAMALRRGE